MGRPKTQKTDLEIVNQIKTLIFSNVVNVSALEDYGFQMSEDKKKIVGFDGTAAAKTEKAKSSMTEEEAKKIIEKIKSVFSESEEISLEELKKSGYYIYTNPDGTIQSFSYKRG